MYTAVRLGAPSPPVEALSSAGLHLAAMTKKVLLVDADRVFTGAVCPRSTRLRVEVNAVNSAAGALALLGSRRFDAVLVDFRLASQGEEAICPPPPNARNRESTSFSWWKGWAMPHRIRSCDCADIRC